MDCLQEWDDFMRLGIPGMLMLFAEWWSYELGAFLAGKMNAKASVEGCEIYMPRTFICNM